MLGSLELDRTVVNLSSSWSLVSGLRRGHRGLSFPPGWPGQANPEHLGREWPGQCRGLSSPSPSSLCPASQYPEVHVHAPVCCSHFSDGFICPHLHKKHHALSLMSRPIWQYEPPLGLPLAESLAGQELL